MRMRRGMIVYTWKCHYFFLTLTIRKYYTIIFPSRAIHIYYPLFLQREMRMGEKHDDWEKRYYENLLITNKGKNEIFFFINFMPKRRRDTGMKR